VAKRYSRHRNYRLSDELMLEVEAYARENVISESEAVRRLLHATMLQLNNPHPRSLSAQERNASDADKRQ
jgi:hypothetical protein